MKGAQSIAATFFVILCILHQCTPYPSGAPLVACQEMRPYHPPTTTSGAPPFAINLTSAVYKPGSEIKGTIYSPSGVVFRGFLIQARTASNSDMTPFGEFIVAGTDTHTNCGNGNKQALTHTTNSNKTKIDFTWKAPTSSQGDLHFKMTIVESYNVSRFWLGIYSSVVKDCSLHPSSDCDEITTEKPVTSPGETAETSPAHTSPPEVITTMAPGKKIPNDPACGVTKGCFPDCSSGCDYLVTWQQAPTNGIEGVDFDLKMMAEDMDNVWIAIGISPTGKMDGTNVIACLSGNDVMVESSYNEGYSNVMYSSKTMGLSNMQGSARDGVITCSFTRAMSLNITDFMNLKDEAYLLVGSGPVINGVKQMHQKIPVGSANKVNFLSHSPGETTGTSPAETTGTIVHTSPSEVITTTAPGKKIPNDPACGVTKGCFPDCSSGCDYLVTWQQAPANGIEGVDFDLKMMAEDMDNVWIAIGLSPTGKMDGTNVIACLSGNDVTVESSYNKGYSNVMYSSKTMGLSNMQGSARDGVITCSFTRAMSLNITDFMNLKDEAYLLVGSGPVINGVKQMHQKIPVGSANKVNFLSHSPGETTGTSPAETTGTIVHTSPSEVITTTAPGKKIPNDPACGVTKGCFPDCSSGCDYLVTWQQAPANGIEGVDFDLKMMAEDMDNVWIAIGISPTGKMDDTNVIACLSGNDVTVESSHNEGYSNVMYSSKTMGLSNMQGSARDGVITCSFTRAMSLNITDFMNLKDEAYLLVGTGPVTNGIKQQHTKNPVGSASKVNFLSHGVSKESDSATPLIKLHGSLMVLAWVLCSSIGVVVARHCKSMMQGNMLCSVKYWFAIHRTLMFVVVLCVVVAFVAIFYEVGGFSKISAEAGKEYTKAHPYLGIIVTVLTLLNPIMAFFRPPPDHKSRPMFNWAHFSVGTAAHLISDINFYGLECKRRAAITQWINASTSGNRKTWYTLNCIGLQVITIFFGIKLSKAKVDKYAIDVMICYTVIFVLVQLILEVHRRRSASGKNNYGKLNPSSGKHGPLTSIPMASYRTVQIDASDETEEESSKFANFVLFLHVIVMIISATLLVLMICIPTHFHATK